MELTHENIKTAILKLREEYLREYNMLPDRINNGCCNDFANDISNAFYDVPELLVLCNHNFMIDGEDLTDTVDNVWDTTMIAEKWPQIILPEGVTWYRMKYNQII